MTNGKNYKFECDSGSKMKNIVFYLNGVKKEGLVVNDDGKELTVKLSNGYNIVVKKKEIKVINSKEISKSSKKHNRKVGNDAGRDDKVKVLILHTGGTIASKVDYETGAVSSKFSPDELLSLFPELDDIASIQSELLWNIASDDMRFVHYNIFIKKILEMQDKVDGIVITHGTDTMHYTSAALHYALPSLKIPVLLVGAQRSSDRPSSDAFLNLVSAVKFIEFCKKEGLIFNDVGVCMHEGLDDEWCIILHGSNVKKLHSSRRDAFKPINKIPVARINFYKNVVEVLLDDYFNRDVSDDFFLFDEEIRVGILKAHPNMWPEEILAYRGFDGVVLEGTGLGHFPINVSDDLTEVHGEIFEALRSLINSGTVVVMSTQTVFGRVNMNVYSPGRRMQEIGVLGNLGNLCSESLFVKLALGLSNRDKANLVEFLKNE